MARTLNLGVAPVNTVLCLEEAGMKRSFIFGKSVQFMMKSWNVKGVAQSIGHHQELGQNGSIIQPQAD
jgi:hypothetical protein